MQLSKQKSFCKVRDSVRVGHLLCHFAATLIFHLTQMLPKTFTFLSLLNNCICLLEINHTLTF